MHPVHKLGKTHRGIGGGSKPCRSGNQIVPRHGAVPFAPGARRYMQKDQGQSYRERSGEKLLGI